MAIGALMLAACGSRTAPLEPIAPAAAPADAGIEAALPDASPPKRGWVSAKDSAFKTFSPDGACVSNTGCPFQGTPIPLCPEGTHWVSLSEALAQAAQGSTSVVVSSPIWFIRSTPYSPLVQCRKCCEYHFGKLSLGQSASHYPPPGEVVAGLYEYQWPEAFRWIGDESARCAGFDVHDGQIVVARGEAQPTSERSFSLKHAEICVQEGAKP